jgi:hypothetical protein
MVGSNQSSEGNKMSVQGDSERAKYEPPKVEVLAIADGTRFTVVGGASCVPGVDKICP